MPCENHPEVEEGLDACYGCGLPFCPNCLLKLGEQKFCAACKADAVKDIQSGVDRSSTLPLAHLGWRFLAMLIDGLVQGAIMIPVFLIFFGMVAAQGPPDPDDPFAMLVPQLVLQVFSLVLPFVYEGVMLQWRGQTFGKMAVGIKVVTPLGKDITPGQAWLRALVRSLLSMCCFLIDYIPAFTTPEKTCVHDMAGKTRVVKLRP